jgi:hypothetical protein
MTQNERPSVQVLREAIELQILKGADYNNSVSSVQQADYYVHGVWSIMDTIHGKYLRMVSVLETMDAGGKVNYESVEDSALDLINYTSFLAAYMRGEVPGQRPDRDIFNKPVDEPTSLLIPTFFRRSSWVEVPTVFPNQKGHLCDEC